MKDGCLLLHIPLYDHDVFNRFEWNSPAGYYGKVIMESMAFLLSSAWSGQATKHTSGPSRCLLNPADSRSRPLHYSARRRCGLLLDYKDLSHCSVCNESGECPRE